MTPKTQAPKVKVNRLHQNKKKHFGSNRLCAIEGLEKIFPSHISNKGIGPRICMKLLQPNNKKSKQPD
jgi:hypothetical protein